MKKRIIFFLFFISFIQCAFPQSGVHDGGNYIKRIENNLIIYGMHELRSKTGREKLFFGDFNAPVEFFYNPAYEGTSCFRLVRDSLGVYLELKYISNYKEAVKEVDDKYASNPLITGEMKDNYWNDVYELFNIETRLFPISEMFADKLFEKMVYFIANFKAKVNPGLRVGGGYAVIFRTVVDENEQWSLWIHTPKGDALRMANLCRQIIEDMQFNKLDESKYITVLNTFEN